MDAGEGNREADFTWSHLNAEEEERKRPIGWTGLIYLGLLVVFLLWSVAGWGRIHNN